MLALESGESPASLASVRKAPHHPPTRTPNNRLSLGIFWVGLERAPQGRVGSRGDIHRFRGLSVPGRRAHGTLQHPLPGPETVSRVCVATPSAKEGGVGRVDVL